MFSRKRIKAVELIKNNDRQEKIDNAVDKFLFEYHNKDVFNCMKQLGVLEDLNVKDVDFYSGLAYYLAKDYDNAIYYFLNISPSSPTYKEALKGLATIYRDKGDYFNIDKLFFNSPSLLDSVTKFNFRLQCLINMELEETHQRINFF